MSKKFLKEVMSMIAGKPAEGLVDILDTSRYVNEVLIAKKLGLTINQTRNILYRISDKGLVSSIRKKEKKKGWYAYFWRIETLKSLEFIKKILSARIEQFQNQIKTREAKMFYICERCYIEFNEENALLQNFTCQECGGIFALKDNSNLIKEMKKNADKLSKELREVEEEIEKETLKLDKKRQREFKKEEKEKEAKKLAKKIARKAAKKKTVKKAVKKKVVKKAVKKKVVKKNSKK